MARGDDDLRDERQRAVDLREHPLELRDEKRQQHDQHHHRQHQQDARIQHRRHDLRFQVLFARLKFRDLRQHHVEKSARLARLDHRDVNARKSLRRFRHRVGQRHAVHDHVVNFLPLCLRHRRRGFLGQNHQCAAQRHARREQTGQQPREIFQFLRRNFFRLEIELKFFRGRQPAGQSPNRLSRRRLFRQQVTGRRPSVSIWRIASGRLGASKLSLGNLAVRLQAFVSERGHGNLRFAPPRFPRWFGRF